MVSRKLVTSKRKPKNYLSNKDLLLEIVSSKANSQMSELLGKQLILLIERIATKPNYRGYSYIDEMKSNAIVHLMTVWDKFDPSKSSNPFSYYTTCIEHSFVQVLNTEKRAQETRDQILLDNGLNPSLHYGDADINPQRNSID